jgi:hypothetical protein
MKACNYEKGCLIKAIRLAGVRAMAAAAADLLKKQRDVILAVSFAHWDTTDGQTGILAK